MAKQLRWLLIPIALMAAVACDDDEDTDTGILRAATYNAGLAPGFVPLADLRAPATAEALADASAELPLDLLCVQELWLSPDLDALVATTDTALPVAVFLDALPAEPDPDALPACAPADVGPLVECAADRCANVAPDQLSGCVLSLCGDPFAAAADECQRCLGTSVGSGLDEALLVCTTGPGPQFAFGASFGTAVLTNGTLLATEARVFDSTLNRRAALFTRIEFPSVGEVDVYCTHLTAAFDSIPFPGQGSWELEQRRQVQDLLEFIDDTADPDTPVLLLGDLNTGPSAAGVASEVPENYALVEAAGFANPHLDSGNAQCTFCEDNALVVGVDAQSAIIDHVLVANAVFEILDVRRILTQEVDIAIDGSIITTPLSDHYGLFVELLFDAR